MSRKYKELYVICKFGNRISIIFTVRFRFLFFNNNSLLLCEIITQKLKFYL
jgi:hypothetical protein